MRPFLFLFILLLLIVSAGCVANTKYASRDTSKISPSTIRSFQLVPGESSICTQDGKPIIRLFSTTFCPHCRWINETFNGVMDEYVSAGKIVAYHWDVDVSNNQFTPEKESSIPPSETDWISKVNPDLTVPTYVFGCKYFRVGNAYETVDDLDAEAGEFKAVIEKLLMEVKSQPA